MKLLATELAIRILVAHAHQTLEEPLAFFTDFVGTQLAVRVLVEILEDLFGTGAVRLLFIFRPNGLAETQCRADKHRPTELTPFHIAQLPLDRKRVVSAPADGFDMG